MINHNLTIEQIQMKLTSRNYIIDVEYGSQAIRANAKYKTLEIAMLFVFIVIILTFLFGIVTITGKLAGFLAVIWVVSAIFLRSCRYTELRTIDEEFKIMKLDTAHQLFACWVEFDNCSDEEKNNTFEKQIAPYVGLQKIKSKDNEDNDG